MTDKKPPIKNPVDQVQGDLRAVGAFFRSLWKATERADRAVETAKEDPERTPRRTARKEPQTIDVRDESQGKVCGVCGGTRLVGDKIKVNCPACVKP